MTGEPIAGSYYEKELQKTNQEKLRIEKVLKKRMINCTSNGKGMIVDLIVRLIKRPQIIISSQYFPKTFRSFGGNINVKVDLSKYATKTDLENVHTLILQVLH